MVVIVLLQAIIVLWGIEQVTLLRIERAKLSAYMGRGLVIAFIAGFASIVTAAAPAPIGDVLVAVIAAHGLVTAPLLFGLRRRRAAITETSPNTRTPTQLL
jgi:hypothetical protein